MGTPQTHACNSLAQPTNGHFSKLPPLTPPYVPIPPLPSHKHTHPTKNAGPSSSQQAEEVVPGLTAALTTLLPHVAPLPLSLSALNKRRWYPQQHGPTGMLFRGCLQQPEGALLLLDERQLSTGQLGDSGVKNLQVTTRGRVLEEEEGFSGLQGLGLLSLSTQSVWWALIEQESCLLHFASGALPNIRTLNSHTLSPPPQQFTPPPQTGSASGVGPAAAALWLPGVQPEPAHQPASSAHQLCWQEPAEGQLPHAAAAPAATEAPARH